MLFSSRVYVLPGMLGFLIRGKCIYMYMYIHQHIRSVHVIHCTRITVHISDWKTLNFISCVVERFLKMGESISKQWLTVQKTVTYGNFVRTEESSLMYVAPENHLTNFLPIFLS